MKLDRQLRGERLATVPEAASLLGKAGGDATSPRTFAAQNPPMPRRLLLSAAACMALGLLALYFLGALPVGGSSGAWIRSLPKKRHNPAAMMPELPQPTNAQLDAAASQLEGGGLHSGDQFGSSTGSDGADPASGDSRGAQGSNDGTPGSGGDVSGEDGNTDAADIRHTAAQSAEPNAESQPQAAAADAKAAAPNQASALAGNDEELQAAADSPAEQPTDQTDVSEPDVEPSPASKAVRAEGSSTKAQDSGSGRDPDAVHRSKGSSQPASSGADGPLASEDSSGELAAAPEEELSSSGVAPGKNDGDTALSSAGGPFNSHQHPAAGSRSADESQEDDGGGLSRASAPDEAALLSDPEAKEAQPDTQPDTAADSSDGSSAGPSAVAQQPDAAGGGDAGADPQGGAAEASEQPAAKTKADDSGSTPAAGPQSSASTGRGSSGSNKVSSSTKGSGSDGGSGGGSKAKGGTDANRAKGKGQGNKKPAGRKVAAGQRGGSGGERIALAMQAGDQARGAQSQEGWLAFAPAGCHLIPGEKEPLRWPQCENPPNQTIKGGPDCSFDLAEALHPCPIIGGGLYFEHEKAQPACEAPPFWREGGLESPSCASDGVCCSGDGINGTWQETSADQAYGPLEFRPDESMGCHFHQYTRRQVLSCLANTTVVFWGDSMVRQLFNRIPVLFRGQRRSFDAQTWRAERFEVCEAADVRAHAPVIEGIAPRDFHYRQWGLAELTDEPHPFLSLDQVPETELLDLVDPHAKPKAFPGQTCGKTQPVSFQYIPATACWEQYRFGGFYLKTHQDISQSIWVSQVGFWDLDHRELNESWIQTMQEALDRGLQKLVLITAPTANIGIDERDPRRWIVRDRNDHMRRWAANDTTGRTVVLDMDTLSLAPNAPGGLLGNWTDWHYSCKFAWVDEHEGRNLTAEEWTPHSHTWLDPSGWTLGGLQPNLRRDCIDDMNRTVLQILFNMLCNKQN